MKFALASYGTRGDVEPCAAVGVELLRRGHDVCMAAPPNLAGFVESAGLAAVPYGPSSEAMPEFFRSSWKMQNQFRLLREAVQHVSQSWAEMSMALRSVANGADLLVTGVPYQESAANVAEYYGIPLAAVHHVPIRVNGQVGFPTVVRAPAPLVRWVLAAGDWVQWRMTKRAEDAQRRELGLPRAVRPASRRMLQRGTLEIQAYDELCFPGLAAEWGGQRPFVGALTMALPTSTDAEVASWIAAGPPPIFFGFGSLPVESPDKLIAMIGSACSQLGERALICSAATDFKATLQPADVKVVGSVNFATVFPTCRAVVHHGGSGTTAAGMRAGVPSLILWSTADQPVWAAQVKQLKVGSARRLSATTRESLVSGLRRILAPEYIARASEVGARMINSTTSVTSTADLLEDAVRRGVQLPPKNLRNRGIGYR
ncbi:MAG TPA: glycosyltransferase [Steroidobacteraceae bacterium]|jgi:UDP:flavonoid glycosyltransferase YjiC (YdhE family)|nr:glycosyltransferase [Steroidobacteraceae bacterium]